MYRQSMPSPAHGDRAQADRLDRGQRVLRDQLGQELHRGVLRRDRQRQEHQRQHEDEPHGGPDRAGRVPDDRAQPEPDQRGHAQVGAGHQHGPQHAGLAERRVRGRARHRGLPGQESGEGEDLPGRQRDGADHGRLGREQQRAVRHRGQRRADHPGGELAGDGQRPERGHDQLADGQAHEGVLGGVERRAVGGRHVRVVRRVRGEREDRQADHPGGHDAQHPPGGADAAQLDPLHPRHGAEPVVPLRTTGHPDGSHGTAVMPASSGRPGWPGPGIRCFRT